MSTYNPEQPIVRSKHLRNLIRGGIPLTYRQELWYSLSGAKEKARSGPTYCDLAKQPSPCLVDIEKDVVRTFPNHPYFANQEGKTTLKRLLCAYSVRNPDIGYCQSMNFLAGLLLLVMDEEKAFWTFATIIEDHLQDYFCPSLVGSVVDLRIFRYFFRWNFPRMDNHLEKHEFQTSATVTKWFMCIYVNTLPTGTVFRIWDCFFYEYSGVLFHIAAGIFKMHEKQIMETNDSVGLYELINNITATLFDADTLMKVSFTEVRNLRPKVLRPLRLKLWVDAHSGIEEQNRTRDFLTLQCNTHFSKEELSLLYDKVFGYHDEAVNRERFRNVLSQYKPSLLGLSYRLFPIFDRDGDGRLNFKELATALSILSKGTTDEILSVFYQLMIQLKEESETEDGYWVPPNKSTSSSQKHSKSVTILSSSSSYELKSSSSASSLEVEAMRSFEDQNDDDEEENLSDSKNSRGIKSLELKQVHKNQQQNTVVYGSDFVNFLKHLYQLYFQNNNYSGVVSQHYPKESFLENPISFDVFKNEMLKHSDVMNGFGLISVGNNQ